VTGRHDPGGMTGGTNGATTGPFAVTLERCDGWRGRRAGTGVLAARPGRAAPARRRRAGLNYVEGNGTSPQVGWDTRQCQGPRWECTAGSEPLVAHDVLIVQVLIVGEPRRILQGMVEIRSWEPGQSRTGRLPEPL
jgi:hypothetical protein